MDPKKERWTIIIILGLSVIWSIIAVTLPPYFGVTLKPEIVTYLTSVRDLCLGALIAVLKGASDSTKTQ